MFDWSRTNLDSAGFTGFEQSAAPLAILALLVVALTASLRR
jgi:hypothetical protein